MNNEILTNYHLTPKDYLEAQQLEQYQSRKLLSKIILPIMLLASMIISYYRIDDPSFLVVSSFAQYSSEEMREVYIISTVVSLLGFLVFIGDLFPKLSLLSRWKNFKKYQNNFINQEQRYISISLTALTITTDNYRVSRQWNDFNKVSEGKRMFLLYHSRNQNYTIIPKRIFKNETDLNYFRNLLNSK